MARDFYAEAAERFGMNKQDADNLLEFLDAVGFDPERNTLGPRGKFADDVADGVAAVYEGVEKEVELPFESQWAIDPKWKYGVDEMLEPFEVVDVTFEYEEVP